MAGVLLKERASAGQMTGHQSYLELQVNTTAFMADYGKISSPVFALFRAMFQRYAAARILALVRVQQSADP